MISFVINITLFIFQCTFHVKQNISINFFFSEGRPFHQEATLIDRVESNGNSFGIENLYIRSGKQWIIFGKLDQKEKDFTVNSASSKSYQQLSNNFFPFLPLTETSRRYISLGKFIFVHIDC